MYFPISICKIKRFCADFIVMRKLYIPYLEDAACEILLYLDYWFTGRRALNALPYISLLKMKRPIVGPLLRRQTDGWTTDGGGYL